MLEQEPPVPTKTVSGMWQDPHNGEWSGEAQSVPEDGAWHTKELYQEAQKRYEADPEGDELERRAIGKAATINSGDLFSVPPATHPEADPADNFGDAVEDSGDYSVPPAGYTG